MNTCVCADADARLHTVAYDPTATVLMFKWCRQCDKHYARCRCETPAFFIISAGKDITAQVEHGLPSVGGGGIVIPDLTRR
jgi:hypothetical protein